MANVRGRGIGHPLVEQAIPEFQVAPGVFINNDGQIRANAPWAQDIVMEPPIRPRPVPAPPPLDIWGDPNEREEEEEVFAFDDEEEEEENEDERRERRERIRQIDEMRDIRRRLGIDDLDPNAMPKEKKVRVRADYSSRVSSTKSTRLPLFKMAYEGADEMTLRLQGTLISAHDTMLYVRQIQIVQCDFSNEVGLGAQCNFPDGSLRGIIFNKERTNLRSPDPGYIQLDDVALHYHRIPARVYKQGINSENTMFTATHSGMRYAVFGHYAIEDILTSFDERPVIQWADVWPEKFLSYRLSDRVALSRNNGGKVINAHYKGRKVGTILDRKLRLIKDVESDFWMSRAFAAVGIEL